MWIARARVIEEALLSWRGREYVNVNQCVSIPLLILFLLYIYIHRSSDKKDLSNKSIIIYKYIVTKDITFISDPVKNLRREAEHKLIHNSSTTNKKNTNAPKLTLNP